MRLRTFTVSLIIAAAATLPLSGVAAAQPGDRDCADFSSQQEAQAALESDVGDPERLDQDNDGTACDNFDFSAVTPSSSTTPTSTSSAAPTTTPTATPTTSPPAPTTTSAAPTTTKMPDKGGQVAVIPRGGVDTGDGTTDDGPAAPLLIGGVVALGAVAAGTRHRAQRSR